MNDLGDLREKIAEAKSRLPMPQLMRRMGYHEKYIGKTALCPFHSDEHPSFSVFEGKGGWQHKCHVGCSQGDEIAFLVKARNLSRREAIKLYLDMASFPAAGAPPKSHEYPVFRGSPKCPKSPEYHKSPESREYHVYPVSNGQGLEKELKDLAARCACTRADDRAGRRRFKLARGARAVEERIGRELTTGERLLALTEWHRVSQPFLDPNDDHLAMFLAELGKVRVPTGEGETIKKALEYVLTLPVSELPEIPGIPDTRESWRRIAALHRELSRRSTKTNKTYFLGCRDAASVFPGLSHQTAYNITLALAQLGVIKIVRIGDKRPNGKASEFRYLLPRTEDGAPQAENECHASKDRGGQNADDCVWP
jgi:CHC2 zinc finger